MLTKNDKFRKNHDNNCVFSAHGVRNYILFRENLRTISQFATL